MVRHRGFLWTHGHIPGHRGEKPWEREHLGGGALAPRRATWRFSSAANLAAFEADPEAYAPQYGGYCAWAVSQGYTASTDPTAWRIVDGKLYLNYSQGVQRRWEQDIPGNIVKADTNWPKVLE